MTRDEEEPTRRTGKPRNLGESMDRDQRRRTSTLFEVRGRTRVVVVVAVVVLGVLAYRLASTLLGVH